MKHQKLLFGQDMQAAANAIGDLHYESLRDLLGKLSDKLANDGLADLSRDRPRLSAALRDASKQIDGASQAISVAWEISKPYMIEGTPS